MIANDARVVRLDRAEVDAIAGARRAARNRGRLAENAPIREDSDALGAIGELVAARELGIVVDRSTRPDAGVDGRLRTELGELLLDVKCRDHENNGVPASDLYVSHKVKRRAEAYVLVQAVKPDAANYPAGFLAGWYPGALAFDHGRKDDGYAYGPSVVVPRGALYPIRALPYFPPAEARAVTRCAARLSFGGASHDSEKRGASLSIDGAEVGYAYPISWAPLRLVADPEWSVAYAVGGALGSRVNGAFRSLDGALDFLAAQWALERAGLPTLEWGLLT